MNWLTNFVRPKLRALVHRKSVPENLWDKCPNCSQLIFHRELETNLYVCPHCNHHMRLSAEKRSPSATVPARRANSTSAPPM